MSRAATFYLKGAATRVPVALALIIEHASGEGHLLGPQTAVTSRRHGAQTTEGGEEEGCVQDGKHGPRQQSNEHVSTEVLKTVS